ncbi:hypothetical protein RYX36_017581 [Vicia faba]
MARGSVFRFGRRLRSKLSNSLKPETNSNNNNNLITTLPRYLPATPLSFQHHNRHNNAFSSSSTTGGQKRSMFIQTQSTSNPESLMFHPSKPVMDIGSADFPNARSAMNSPLAKSLFAIQANDMLASRSAPSSSERETHLLSASVYLIISCSSFTSKLSLIDARISPVSSLSTIDSGMAMRVVAAKLCSDEHVSCSNGYCFLAVDDESI